MKLARITNYFGSELELGDKVYDVGMWYPADELQEAIGRISAFIPSETIDVLPDGPPLTFQDIAPFCERWIKFLLDDPTAKDLGDPASILQPLLSQLRAIVAKMSDAPAPPDKRSVCYSNLADVAGELKRYRDWGRAATTASVNDTPDITSTQPPNPPDMPVTKEGAAILRFLNKKHPVLQTQVEIEAGTDIEKQTVRLYLGKFRDAELIHRPEGERKGEGLTDKGKKFADSLP